MSARGNRILFVVLVILFLTVDVSSAGAAPPSGGICNGPDEPIMVLVLGTDQRNRGYMYGLADSIMVFRVDFQGERVEVMSFPRDLWVEIPGIEEADRTHGKLNQAYFFGTKDMGYFEGEGYGAGLMAETLNVNYGLDINHYIVINMRIFVEVIDAIGGIKVYSPSPIYSQHQTKPVLKAGGYVFGGKEAQLYARYRDPRNVLDRTDRHAILLRAVWEQIFSLQTVFRIPELVGAFKGNVLTDLHLAQISQLLCLSTRVGGEGTTYYTIPRDELYHPDWVGSVWLEKEPGFLRELLGEFQNGKLPRPGVFQE